MNFKKEMNDFENFMKTKYYNVRHSAEFYQMNRHFDDAYKHSKEVWKKDLKPGFKELGNILKKTLKNDSLRKTI
jgi:4-alpha-glucanotransferase